MKEIFNILNRLTGAVVFSAEIECKPDELPSIKLGLAVRVAIKARANLARADLAGAYLARADLAGANLAGADLAGAYLAGADLAVAYLAGANLAGANLAGADLARADLAGAYLARADLARAYLARANLAGANLAGAYFAGANLAGASLAGADLAGAYLAGAYLVSANLARANLAGAYLADAKNAELAIARTRILPDGILIGWKKLRNGVIAKVRIPEEAKRSHAWGRKCRAEFVDVIEGDGVSIHDGVTKYAPGLRVTCDKWETDWTKECAGGIHFYITKEEAEAHS